MGFPVATFALATAYFLGDDVLQDHVKAERLFLETYDKSVVWADAGYLQFIQMSFLICLIVLKQENGFKI